MKTKTNTRRNGIRKHKLNKSKNTLDLFNKHVRFKRVNGNTKNDRLEVLKLKYQQDIQETEQKLQVLRAKLNNLVALEHESLKLSNPETEADKYSVLGLTDAILDAVSHLKNVSPSGATASQIRDCVIARGFPLSENPHNFSIAVAVTLKRLTESRRVLCIPNHQAGVRTKKTYQPMRAGK